MIVVIATLLITFFSVYSLPSGKIRLLSRDIEINSELYSRRRVLDRGLHIICVKDREAVLNTIEEVDFRYSYAKDIHLIMVEESWDDERINQLKNNVEFSIPLEHSDKSIINLEKFGDENSVDVIIYLYGDVTNEDVNFFRNMDGISEVVSVRDRIHVRIDMNFKSISKAIETLPRVYFIQIDTSNSLHNYYANEIIQGTYSTTDNLTLHYFDLRGQNQLVTVMDSGLDIFNCYFYDDNVTFSYNQVLSKHRKIYYYDTTYSSHSGDFNDGHGTHICGSIAGNVISTSSNYGYMKKYNGIAPESKIYFQDVGLINGSISIPKDLYSALSDPYLKGSRIFSFSWGCELPFICVINGTCYFSENMVYDSVQYYKDQEIPEIVCINYFGVANGYCYQFCNRYDAMARDLDKFIYENDEMVVFVSVGNYGDFGPSGTVTSPATAKNIISVGSSQTSNDGFKDSIYWSNFTSEIFSMDSTCTDRIINSISDCCSYDGVVCSISSVKEKCCPDFTIEGTDYKDNPNLYTPENIATFSSRGEIFDSRIAPGLVLPGQIISSAKSFRPDSSSSNCFDWRDGPGSGQFEKYGVTRKSGTSISTALLAGSAALIRQYFIEGWFPTGSPVLNNNLTTPSGNLIRAVLFTMTDTLSGHIKNVNVNLTSQSSPNNYYGFGIPKPGKYLQIWGKSKPSYQMMLLDRVNIQFEETISYHFINIGNRTIDEPFRISISYFDPPGHIGSLEVEYNDLDLRVRINNGPLIYGNFEVSRDVRNPVETITLSELSDGDGITIEVYGYVVVSSNFKFSIFATGYDIICSSEYSSSGMEIYNNSKSSSFCMECKEGWFNHPYCNITSCYGILSTNESVCGGNGECVSPNLCICNPGHDDPPKCDSPNICFGKLYNDTENVCSGHGKCIDFNVCECYFDDINGYYYDIECNVTKCLNVFSNQSEDVCSGHGICWGFENCTCDPIDFYFGSNCNTTLCNGILSDNSSFVCNGFGICWPYDECDCNNGTYFGKFCNVTLCDGIFSNDTNNVCSGNGICWPYEICTCQDEYFSENCNITSCYGLFTNDSNVCSSKGICKVFNHCDCDSKYYDEICNVTECFDVLSNDSNVCSTKGTCWGYNNCTCLESTKYYGENCNETFCNGFPTTNRNFNDSVCSEKGICWPYEVCTCETNYYSENCNITKCHDDNIFSNETNVCSSHGICWDYDICTCKDKYYGKICNVTECFGIFSNDSNVCNGFSNVCVALDTCICPNGVFGMECNTTSCNGTWNNDSLSLDTICNGHGICYPKDVCSCDPKTDYFGQFCEYTVCNGIYSNETSNVCNGVGTCWPKDNCSCNVNYFGSWCETTICYDILSNDTTNVCSQKGNCWPYNECKCYNETYFGENCEVTLCDGIFSNDSVKVCTGRGVCWPYEICTCNNTEIYFGENCNVTYCYGIFSNESDIVCSGNGDCVDYDKCNCDPNYYSQYCNVTKCSGLLSNDTSSNVCSNHGVCISNDVCHCDSGYFAQYCNVTTCNNTMSNITSKVCSGHGICWPKDVCSCFPSNNEYFGTYCEYTFCSGQRSNDSGIICSGNGICWPLNECTCNVNYFGDICNITTCHNIFSNDSNVCSSHGICSKYDECLCTEELKYFGEFCNITVCNEIFSNDTNNVCSNYGECITPENCICVTGYYGQYCNVTTCAGKWSNISSTCGTSEHSKCWPKDVCGCDDNYYGMFCNITTCDNIFSNDTNEVCSGGKGICKSFDKCIDCDTNYFGKFCGVTVCGDDVDIGYYSNDTDNVCFGHGSCWPYRKCNCFDNYYGEVCNITICNGIFSNESMIGCSDHGVCNVYENCDCSTNYYGKNCSVYECYGKYTNETSVVCNGHGTCILPNSCVCQAHWYGPACPTTSCYGVFSNESTSLICSGQGDCIDYNTCQCHVITNQYYLGQKCEEMLIGYYPNSFYYFESRNALVITYVVETGGIRLGSFIDGTICNITKLVGNLQALFGIGLNEDTIQCSWIVHSHTRKYASGTKSDGFRIFMKETYPILIEAIAHPFQLLTSNGIFTISVTGLGPITEETTGSSGKSSPGVFESIMIVFGIIVMMFLGCIMIVLVIFLISFVSCVVCCSCCILGCFGCERYLRRRRRKKKNLIGGPEVWDEKGWDVDPKQMDQKELVLQMMINTPEKKKKKKVNSPKALINLLEGEEDDIEADNEEFEMLEKDLY